MVKINVLLLDDEQDTLDCAYEVLEPHFNVIKFTLLSEALNNLNTTKIKLDLIITDNVFKNQDEDGLDCVEKIREQQAADTPFILITGNDASIELERFIKFKNKSYLGKPYDTEDLIEKSKAIIYSYVKNNLDQNNINIINLINKLKE